MDKQGCCFCKWTSGDFISGGHAEIENIENNKLSSLDKRKENSQNQLIKKHFSLWGYLKMKKYKCFKKILWNEINSMPVAN